LRWNLRILRIHGMFEASGRSLTYTMQIPQSPDMMSAKLQYGLYFIS